jgi:hypothetical protein
MMAVYKRLGVPKCGSLVRWAKPLRTKGKLEPVIGSNPITRGVSSVADMALSLRGWKGSSKTCDIALHESAFGEEFSELDSKLRSQPGVRTLRSAEFLNWRYQPHPVKKHEIITARRMGTLVGYVVFTLDEEDMSIVDLSSVEEPPVIARLLGAAVERLRHHGAATVSMNAGDKHPWNAVFHRAGFRPREESPVVVCMSPGGEQSLADFQQSWYLMRGERDS